MNGSVIPPTLRLILLILAHASIKSPITNLSVYTMATCMNSVAAAATRTAVKSLKQRASFGTAVKPLRVAVPLNASRRALVTNASADGTSI